MTTLPRQIRFDAGESIMGWQPRIAVAPCLHNLPLVHGLAGAGVARLMRDGNERLGDLLVARRADAALLDATELQRRDLQPLILPIGCIAAEGPTQTACIYSRTAPGTIRQLCAGPESAAAAMVARILWAESFERHLQVLPRPLRLSQRISERPQAILLSGDEVNRRPGNDFVWRIDLGQAWQSLTGLPVVFNVWTMQPDTRVSPTLQARRADICLRMLDKARQAGMMQVENLVGDYAVRFGWQPDQARRYLTSQMQYKFTTRHRRGMEMFFHLARKHGFIQKIRPLSFA